MSTTLKFYNEQCVLNIPAKFEDFKSTICLLLQFPNYNELVIYYIDSDGDKIIVGNEMDFEELKKQINRKEVKEIEATIVEGSIIKFPDIVKNLPQKEDVKPNPQPLISDQKKPESQNVNVIHKEQYHEPKEIAINEQPKLDPQKLNQKTDVKIKELVPPMKKNNEVAHPENIIDLNIKQNQQKKQQTLKNEPDPLQVNNMMQKPIIFDVECSICKEDPIKIVIYLCQQCNMFLCPNCERTHGPTHHHPLLKIRKPENIPKESIVVRPKVQPVPVKDNSENSSFIDSIKQIPNALKNLFYDETKDPQYLIKVARANYELTEISDEAILKALKKTNNNIDEAIILLTQEK